MDSTTSTRSRPTPAPLQQPHVGGQKHVAGPTKCDQCGQVKCRCAEDMLAAIRLGVPVEQMLHGGKSSHETAAKTSHTNSCCHATGTATAAQKMTSSAEPVQSSLPPLSAADRMRGAGIKA